MGKMMRRWLLVAGQVVALFLCGCSLSSNGLVMFPSGQRLLDSTKAVRLDSAQPLPVPRELNKALLPAYIVEPGDVLLVQPADLDSPIRLPADQPVLPDGSINLGRYGRLIVAGQTSEQISGQVHDMIQREEKAAGSNVKVGPMLVRLVVRASKVYYVLGEVNAPGAFPLSGRETVLDGIVAAGGLNQRASQDQIILSRPTRPDGCRIVLPICYRQIVQLGDTTTNYQLMPGDRIFVPTRQSHEDGDCWWMPHRKKTPPLAVCCRPQVRCADPAVCSGGALLPTYQALGKPIPLPLPAPVSEEDPQAIPFSPTPLPSEAPNLSRAPPPDKLPPTLPDMPVPVIVQTAAHEVSQAKSTTPPEGQWHSHQPTKN
ncbi:MAG TPA: SLBB domain-containing protein [Gemmataceae bacterium]|nr:SLBB domain-containing protein [Gemmataceae bacterium]